MSRPRTVHLVAALLLRATKPMSVRQVATEIDRPVRSVSNVMLRLRRAGLVEVVEIIKPLGTRRVCIYAWKKEGSTD